MPDAYIVGVGCTIFGKRPGSDFKALTREVYLELLATRVCLTARR